MTNLTKYSGFLFVGDPHVSSVTPHRRKDIDYRKTICDKIAEAKFIAKQNNLLMIVTGDLLDNEYDSDPETLILLSRALRDYDPPLCLAGNHDVYQSFVTDDTVIAMLREMNQIETIERCGPYAVFEIDGKRVLLGATLHKMEFPESIKDVREKENADFVIWLSHHDLAFGGAYPGSMRIEEIKGVDMLVNGHMHMTKDKVIVGEMVAFNPGNITRQDYTARDHIPSVWMWKPDMGAKLEQKIISHSPSEDVIDVTGKNVEAEKTKASDSKQSEKTYNSIFAEKLLASHTTGDFSQSEDAGYLKEDAQALADELGIPADIRAEIASLFVEALEGPVGLD